jgi:hypothetical protein
LRTVPGRGIRTWGAATLSENPDWRYVNVRRMFIMLRRSIVQGTEWVVFEPNHQKTWLSLTSYVTDFLRKQYTKGAFAGATEEEAFYVKCDEDTNPENVRDLGQMVMEIGVAPALPAEFIIFNVVQQMAASNEEAPVQS